MTESERPETAGEVTTAFTINLGIPFIRNTVEYNRLAP